MIIYEFELNRRKENFFDDLKQVIYYFNLRFIFCFIYFFKFFFKLFEIIEILELKKAKTLSELIIIVP